MIGIGIGIVFKRMRGAIRWTVSILTDEDDKVLTDENDKRMTIREQL